MFKKQTDENREILLQSFYNLEDKIIQKMGRQNVSIAFTATSIGTKKTENILNIARHLAEDGISVLMIDADLRYSNLDDFVEEDAERGFIDVILGGYDVDQVKIKDRAYKSLSYLKTGAVSDYADKFLEPKVVRNFFSDISNEYYYVLVDLTENTDVAEANMFAASTDACLVFTKDELKSSEETQNSLDQLEKANANILGLAITDYDYSEDELDDLFGGYDE